MSNFDGAVEHVLLMEGGESNAKNDSGGLTNFGISTAFLKDNPGVYCPKGNEAYYIRNLNKDRAIQIYKDAFWNPLYDEISVPIVASYIFDMAVNIGKSEAHKITQRALWCMGRNKNCADDGIFGAGTLTLVNSFGVFLMPVLRALRLQFYESLVAYDKEDVSFKDGWIARTLSL